MEYLGPMLLLGICLLTGWRASVKGYKFLVWFFAAGVLGLIVMAFLPSTIDMPPDEQEKKRRIGNIIGIVISAASVIFVLIRNFGG